MPNETTTPPRPKKKDPTILREAAKKIAPHVLDWCNQEGESLTDTDLPGIEDNVFEALKRTDYKHFDGYAMAHALEERDGYSPDECLVEVLASASIHVHEAHTEATRNWVKDNNIVVVLKIGDKVTVKRPLQKEVTGTIASIIQSDATVSVNCPELGHRPMVVSGHLPGTYGIVVGHEQCTKIE